MRILGVPDRPHDRDARRPSRCNLIDVRELDSADCEPRNHQRLGARVEKLQTACDGIFLRRRCEGGHPDIVGAVDIGELVRGRHRKPDQPIRSDELAGLGDRRVRPTDVDAVGTARLDEVRPVVEHEERLVLLAGRTERLGSCHERIVVELLIPQLDDVHAASQRGLEDVSVASSEDEVQAGAREALATSRAIHAAERRASLAIRIWVRVHTRPMRVGEVASRAGVNVETLRYYERRGLLPQPDREPSGHRRYDEETVRFLRAIKEAQALGFTLREIADVLKAVRRSGTPSEALRVRMAAKIDEIDGRIAGLRRMREELARVVGCACDSLDHCTCGAAYLARRGREPVSPPALLHVTNGESAGNTLRQTTLGGAVLPWQDVLHVGPVPAVPRRELLRLRAGFLAEAGWGSRRALLGSLERRDAQLIGALRDGLEVVLWFEHDLYDQLQLLDVLSLAYGSGAAPELVVVDSFPGKPCFRGLGELTAGELETLWPRRRRASAETLATAAEAWEVFRAPEPSALAEWAERDEPELPFLAPALRRLLEELPAPGDGLSGTERRALIAIAAGHASPRDAFLAAQDAEAAPFLGDTWFYSAVAELGVGENRLLESANGEPLPPAPPLGDAQRFVALPLRLTRAGEKVLAGEANRVELLGIDRWVGGAHVTA